MSTVGVQHECTAALYCTESLVVCRRLVRCSTVWVG